MRQRISLPSFFSRQFPGGSSLQGDLDRMFDALARGGAWPMHTPETGLLAPDMNVKETATGIEITAELPGVSEDDVDISVDGRTVTIKGEKKAEHEEKEADYHLVERSYGSFMRSFTLPFDADMSKVDAEFKKGVLTVSLLRPPEAEQTARKIKVRAKD